MAAIACNLALVVHTEAARLASAFPLPCCEVLPCKDAQNAVQTGNIRVRDLAVLMRQRTLIHSRKNKAHVERKSCIYNSTFGALRFVAHCLQKVGVQCCTELRCIANLPQQPDHHKILASTEEKTKFDHHQALLRRCIHWLRARQSQRQRLPMPMHHRQRRG